MSGPRPLSVLAFPTDHQATNEPHEVPLTVERWKLERSVYLRLLDMCAGHGNESVFEDVLRLLLKITGAQRAECTA